MLESGDHTGVDLKPACDRVSLRGLVFGVTSEGHTPAFVYGDRFSAFPRLRGEGAHEARDPLCLFTSVSISFVIFAIWREANTNAF